MKNVSIGLAVALSLAGCSKKKASENKEPAAPMVQESGSAGSAAAAEAPLAGKDLADKYTKCIGMINDGKFDDFTSQCVAADYKGHDVDMGDMNGADSIKNEFASLKKAFPDWKMTPQLVLVNGRNILAVELTTGTNSGPMQMAPSAPETPATNKKLGMLVFHRLTIDDQNKANEEWMYEDPSTMMGQLGLLPKGAPPVRPVIDTSWDGAPNITVAADNDTEKKNLEVAKAMTEAFNARKLPDMLALMTDDAVESDQADAQDYKGKKEIEKDLKGFQSAFSDCKITVDNTWAAGDYVVALGMFEGTNDHDLGTLKKTGKKISIHYAEVLKLKDGKVTNLWRFRNGMATAIQLGVMSPPGAGAGSAAAGSAAGSAAPKK
jgi:ketosteroid isomerase-like protein